VGSGVSVVGCGRRGVRPGWRDGRLCRQGVLPAWQLEGLVENYARGEAADVLPTVTERSQDNEPRDITPLRPRLPQPLHRCELKEADRVGDPCDTPQSAVTISHNPSRSPTTERAKRRLRVRRQRPHLGAALHRDQAEPWCTDSRDPNASNMLDCFGFRRPTFLDPPELAAPGLPATGSGCQPEIRPPSDRANRGRPGDRGSAGLTRTRPGRARRHLATPSRRLVSSGHLWP
jgi:hypothetical protein